MSFADVEVDQKWHRHIIGKSGSNIGRIKNETGTSINIPPDSERSNIIRIEGSPEGVATAKAEILSMAAKMDNEKSRDIIIEQRFHKNIIGQKGEKVREIREKYGEVQISFPEAGKKSDIVTLRGPKEEVDKCYNYMKKLAANLIASNFRMEVPIFKRFHGNVIGRNGANIKKIKEETGVQIDIPTENSNSDIIVLTGYKDKCEKARKMIMAIQSELASIVSKDVNIAQNLHTSLIGAGGKLIQSIMNECGDVHIHFPPEGEKSDKITIRGTEADVEKAVVQLKKLATERQENSFTAEVTAKPEHHRFLIGRGGINIRKVREKTGARIMFPTHADENKETITIIGKQSAVEEAKAELESKIRDLNNVIESEVSIDPKYHKHFIARRAQVLRDLADEFGGVAVSFPRDPNSDKVSVKGAKECVESAKKRMLEIIDDLESMVDVKCVIEQKHHRAVLGAKGVNVQHITSKYSVQVKFPDRSSSTSDDPAGSPPVSPNTEDGAKGSAEGEVPEKKSDIIMISGKKENAEQAKEALLALVPISVSVTIPFENHRFIIGQKGAVIRKMMDEFDVNISVPPPDRQSDIIVVTGTSKNVDPAVEALKKRNDVIEAENEDRRLRSFELVVEVPAEHHPKLIGRRGQVISKLRDEHGVNIQVPNPEQKSNQIRLIGYEEKCQKAQEAILAMVKELEDQVVVELNIDSRVHSRIIGQKGRSVRKLMDMFKVDIRFPRGDNPDLVVISGAEDACEECREHLVMLEEEYMDDVRERMEDRDMMAAYMVDRSSRGGGEGGSPSGGGFVVRDAPWNMPPPGSAPQNVQAEQFSLDAANVQDFPSLGGMASAGKQSKAWGPWGQ